MYIRSADSSVYEIQWPSYLLQDLMLHNSYTLLQQSICATQMFPTPPFMKG